jgi:hypothetical protein
MTYLSLPSSCLAKNFTSYSFIYLLVAAVATSTLALAGSPTSIAITSAPVSVAQGDCSTPVRIQLRDSYGNAASAPSNTNVYFIGMSNSIAIYKDSGCLTAASNSSVVIQAGNSSRRFFLKGSAAGTELLTLSTSDYGGTQQSETVTAGTTPPPPTPAPAGNPRAIPSPIYGVTLDDVSNVSAQITSLGQLSHFPTSRVVFDFSETPSYYAPPLQNLRPVSYVMGLLADSSDMSRYTAASMQTRAQNYVSSLSGLVDVWEVGNEVNGNWLGSDTMDKIEAAYDVVDAARGSTALTFFYEGEPSQKNCIATGNGGNDMFTWIQNNFQLNLPPAQRSAETERIRLGLNYVLISWYPDQCDNIQPDWATVYSKLASIFPNSKTGFGELGTANPQQGSSYEINLINQFYPMAKTTPLPPSFVGGYFWWYYAEEMVPSNATVLFNVLNQAIR